MMKYQHLVILQPDKSKFAECLNKVVSNGWQIINCGFSNGGYGHGQRWWAILRQENE